MSARSLHKGRTGLTGPAGPSRPSTRTGPMGPMLCLLLAGAGLFLDLASCGPPDGAQLFPEASGGCEDATEQNKQTNENMLPGRVCGACHRAGGQATNSPFTISGTVFPANNSPCNNGGIDGTKGNVYVEVLAEDGMTLQDNGRIRVNSVGNFRSAFSYTSPLRVRIRAYQGDPEMGMVVKEQVMMTPMGRGPDGSVKVNCAECHQFPAAGSPQPTGRIFLK